MADIYNKTEKNLYNRKVGVNTVAILGTNEMAKGSYEKFSVDKFAGYNDRIFFQK
ncbi:MAG: hypothetical protein R3A12_07415 [Ignavibacteria bacterium]